MYKNLEQSEPYHSWEAGAPSFCVWFCRPGPASGLSLSSHNVTPSQAQIRFGFSNRPADLATMPQVTLSMGGRERKRRYYFLKPELYEEKFNF